MPSKGDEFVYKFAVLVGVMTFLLIVIYVPPAIDFSVSNPFWNGYSVLSSRLNATILSSPLITRINEPYKIAVITIPYLRYFPDEIINIKRFVANGGVLIILDDYGYSNQLLKAFGNYVTVINDSMLIDPLFCYKNGRLPRIVEFEEKPEVRGIKEVIFNHASALQVISPDTEILAYSSSFSYLDTNLNSRWDVGEREGPFPVIAKFNYGSGLVYVISDPSFLLNSMIDLADNYKLITNLVENRTVIIDQYHLRSNIHYQIREFILSSLSQIRQANIMPYAIIIFMLVVVLLTGKVLADKGVSYE